jgi:glycine cleavage system aminomethyltransferase T/glycine/D-amino acid oxidase-like deaminating enzyme
MSSESSLPETAGTVVVGAGCVGCSAAYHLAERGREDVVVLDQGPLFETGGSTSHAPGLVFQTTGSEFMTKLANYTQELYTDLGGYNRCGGIEVAYTPERWDYLKRKREYGRAWGLEGGELLSPEEVADEVPLVDPEVIHGGYYVPTDGRADGVVASERMAEHAREGGARFFGETEVVDLDVEDGSISAVVTDEGRIDCEEALICTNIWGPLFGDWADVDVPLTPCAHQYLVSEPLEELAGATEEVEQPILRHQDFSLYYRQHGDSYGIGSYDHDPLLVDPEDILAPEESERMPSIREFTAEHFYEPTHPDIDRSAADATAELLPALEGVEFDDAFNGMFSFTPDGMPIMGETEDVEGLWWALAVWVTQSGGVGSVMAEWMDEGVPKLDGERLDVSSAHLSRFQPHTGSRAFTKDRGGQQYQEVYQLIHPNEQPRNQRGLRRSPFYEQQKELGAEFVSSGGWEVPQWYEANESLLEEYDLDLPERSEWQKTGWSPIQAAEHRAVRDNVGIYDLSRYTGIEVAGPGAPAFVQRLFTNDMDTDVGQVRYAPMCDDTGGVLADMAVTRLAEDRFVLTTGGGSSSTLHTRWIREQAPEDGSVSIDAHVSDQCGLGVWGPKAREVLQPLAEEDLSAEEFGYFRAKEFYLDSIPVTALRVSYVGELGWELYAPSEYGGKLWDLVWEAGQDHGMIAFGNGAFLGSLRIEKGFRLWGTDVSPEYDPYEAGLGFAVDLDTDFIGKEALVDAREAGVSRKLACMTLDDEGAIVDSGKPIVDGGGGSSEEALGYVAATDYGYSVGESIAYGYLPAEYVEPGVGVTIEYEGERYDATVREEPRYDPDREKVLG